MFSMQKGAEDLLVGDYVIMEALWKASGGGQKGLRAIAKKAEGVDLDVFTAGYEGTDAVGLASFDDDDPFNNGSVLAGADAKGRGKIFGRGHDLSSESHSARLSTVPSYVTSLVWMVSAFKPGVSFADVSSVTLKATVDGTVQGEKRLPIDSRNNTAVMARAKRTQGGWTFAVLNEAMNATTLEQILNEGRRFAQ
jgi:stress response protein SCP2